MKFQSISVLVLSLYTRVHVRDGVRLCWIWAQLRIMDAFSKANEGTNQQHLGRWVTVYVYAAVVEQVAAD